MYNPQLLRLLEGREEQNVELFGAPDAGEATDADVAEQLPFDVPEEDFTRRAGGLSGRHRTPYCLFINQSDI